MEWRLSTCPFCSSTVENVGFISSLCYDIFPPVVPSNVLLRRNLSQILNVVGPNLASIFFASGSKRPNSSVYSSSTVDFQGRGSIGSRPPLEIFEFSQYSTNQAVTYRCNVTAVAVGGIVIPLEKRRYHTCVSHPSGSIQQVYNISP